MCPGSQAFHGASYCSVLAPEDRTSGRGRTHSQQTDDFSTFISGHPRATTQGPAYNQPGSRTSPGDYRTPRDPPLHPAPERSGTKSSKPALAWASGVGSFCQLMSVQETQQELFSPSDRQTSWGGPVWLIHTCGSDCFQ